MASYCTTFRYQIGLTESNDGDDYPAGTFAFFDPGELTLLQ